MRDSIRPISRLPSFCWTRSVSRPSEEGSIYVILACLRFPSCARMAVSIHFNKQALHVDEIVPVRPRKGGADAHQALASARPRRIDAGTWRARGGSLSKPGDQVRHSVSAGHIE